MRLNAEPTYPSSRMSTRSVPESVSSRRYAVSLSDIVARMLHGSARIGESTRDDDSDGRCVLLKVREG